MRSSVFAPGWVQGFTESTRVTSRPLTCFIIESLIIPIFFFDDTDDEAVPAFSR